MIRLKHTYPNGSIGYAYKSPDGKMSVEQWRFAMAEIKGPGVVLEMQILENNTWVRWKKE